MKRKGVLSLVVCMMTVLSLVIGAHPAPAGSKPAAPVPPKPQFISWEDQIGLTSEQK